MRAVLLVAGAILGMASCVQAPVRPASEQYWNREGIAVHAATLLCQKRGIPAKYSDFVSKDPKSDSYEALRTLREIHCLSDSMFVTPHYRILRVIDLCEQSEGVASVRRLVRRDFRPDYTVGCPPDPATELQLTPVERAFDAMEAACSADRAKFERVVWGERDEFVISIECVIRLPALKPDVHAWTVSSSMVHVCDAYEDTTHLREALISSREFPIDCSRHEATAGIEERERGRQKTRQCLKQHPAEHERCDVVPGTELLP